MAEPITPTDPLDVKTRSNLAYIFTLGSIVMLGYILYRWGDKLEILTLIIGLIGGTLLGSVSGVFFGGGTTSKKPDNAVTASSVGTVNNNITTDPPATVS